MNSRFGEFHHKIGRRQSLAIHTVKIGRAPAFVLQIQSIVDDFVRLSLVAQGQRHTHAIVSARFSLTWAVDLRAVVALQSCGASTREAVARRRKHMQIQANGVLVARLIVAWPQVAASTDDARRAFANVAFGRVQALARLARARGAEILLNLARFAFISVGALAHDGAFDVDTRATVATATGQTSVGRVLASFATEAIAAQAFVRRAVELTTGAAVLAWRRSAQIGLELAMRS